MNLHPGVIHCGNQSFFEFVRNDRCGMPPGSSTDKVEDYMFMDEQQIAFDFLIESITNFQVASMRRAGFRPLAANSAGLYDLWYDLQNHVLHSTLVEHAMITGADACHQRTCSFRSESLIAPSCCVVNIRTTRPMSKLLQSSGLSGLFPASRSR